MNMRISVDGVEGAQVSPRDRGLAYGDGLFETVRVIDGHAPLWPRHMARLRRGCQRLAIACPDATALLAEVRRLAADSHAAVARISVTRGLGERGYAPPVHAAPCIIVQVAPAPNWPADWYSEGLQVGLCRTRLAEQPALAGLKHLNRLEQVLARAEWNNPAQAEGLMCDMHGRVVSATSANVFAVIDGVLTTPALERCGVEGVARAELLARAAGDVAVRDIALEEWMGSSEWFISSSVRGIVPIRMLDGQPREAGPVARRWQQCWRQAGLHPCGAHAA
ncbi:aminodeoxychorismate lyase [Oleiagrimonas sp. C23AA]|uniref:aminodeoxychorismate lyase n=1 Tax=Oleiagrimonas sp. C23AA TaxID=2719047 RepID=UPI001420EE02|nr:aminodeoxychorismate lyase [Oleiagrimonas sp. C23AA]NII10322.1 aminodeoxychorismate lyase [Oleiagrimonas sp. C23AA]